MVQETRIKELLEEKAGEVYAGEAGKKARETYSRLKVRSARQSVAGKAEGFERVRTYLLRRGELLDSEQGKYLLAMTGSGVKNMNPTVVELIFEGGTLNLTAWAKEGLIPQRSAEKAIRDCLEVLASS